MSDHNETRGGDWGDDGLVKHRRYPGDGAWLANGLRLFIAACVVALAVIVALGILELAGVTK